MHVWPLLESEKSGWLLPVRSALQQYYCRAQAPCQQGDNHCVAPDRCTCMIAGA
jgi:hypothetical protein